MNSDRDRDALGRPRNARPRDALGRPLPRGSTSDIERVPDDLAMPVPEALALARRYLDEGLPFHAHEVFEALWKSQPGTERDLWQGLAQIAVGLTHAFRGNAAGARSLLKRGCDRLRTYPGNTHGVDVDGVVTGVEVCVHGPDADGPDADELDARQRAGAARLATRVSRSLGSRPAESR